MARFWKGDPNLTLVGGWSSFLRVLLPTMFYHEKLTWKIIFLLCNILMSVKTKSDHFVNTKVVLNLWRSYFLLAIFFSLRTQAKVCFLFKFLAIPSMPSEWLFYGSASVWVVSFSYDACSKWAVFFLKDCWFMYEQCLNEQSFGKKTAYLSMSSILKKTAHI